MNEKINLEQSKLSFSSELNSAVDKFTQKFGEKTSDLLQNQILNNEDLQDRKNFNGHATASGFLLSKDESKVLLVHNKGLNKWLQPGGHCDPEDVSPLAAARREIIEETGIQDFKLHSSLGSTPLDIDTHSIPSRSAKNEESHFHHDIRYLFKIEEDSGDLSEKIDPSEIGGWEWVSIVDATKLPLKISKRILSIIDKR